jgi:glucose dehydrogenase
VIAIDAASGDPSWVFHTVPHPGEFGHDTWPADSDAWQRGGVGVWANAAVDEELGLVFFGTGNAFPQYAGEARPGDNLFSASLVAVDLKTGQYRWHFQTVHHEIWEADVSAPPVLYDAVVDGKKVKAIAVARVDGFLFMLDRATGKPVFPVEERPVKQSRQNMTARTQPFPVGADKLGPGCVEPDMVPAGFVLGCWWDPVDENQPNLLTPTSATRFASMSYSPRANLFFVSGGVGSGWVRRGLDPNFFNFLSYRPPGMKSYGLLAAFDARTNKIVWQRQLPLPISFGPGTTVTAGGVLFHGGPDGLLHAFDAAKGTPLWEFQTGAAVTSPPAVYEIAGESAARSPRARHRARPGRPTPTLWGLRRPGRSRNSRAASTTPTRSRCRPCCRTR